MEIQWSLALFTVVAGAGAWLLACIFISNLRSKTSEIESLGLILGIILLITGGLISVFHLSHPTRIMAALNQPTSGIFLEAVSLGLLALVGIIFAVIRKRSPKSGALRVFAIIGILGAIIFTYFTGSSYVMASREAWNTQFLPLGYMATAASSGIALYFLLNAIKNVEFKNILDSAKALIIASIAVIIITIIFGFISGAATSNQALLFWLGVVAVGGIIPLIVAFFVIKQKNAKNAIMFATLGFIAALAGSIAFRALMWLIGTPIMSLLP